MKLYEKNDKFTIYNDSCLKMLEEIECNSIDSIVTDPPYELNFMGKSWDNTGIAFQKETWEKCYQVLKPGGHLLAFGGSRTFHRIACAIEDAGFEIRDTIMWLYGSGFPKSMNLGKSIESKLLNGSANKQDFKNLDGDKVQAGNWGIAQMSYEQGFRPSNYDLDEHMRVTKVNYQTKEGKQWDGWGTQLKPAFEPVIVARKPCEKSITDNVLKYGVGGINIDECRVGTETRQNSQAGYIRRGRTDEEVFMGTDKNKPDGVYFVNGRFPANVILTYDDSDYEEVCGGFPYSKSQLTKNDNRENKGNSMFVNGVHNENNSYEDSGSASRYFYCAKASKRDRDEGLEEFAYTKGGTYNGHQDGSFKTEIIRKNGHPCVKPTTLMSYLVRLVTPKGGIVLDPFMGSGSTGKATMYENVDRDANYKFIGIEMQEEYCNIARARIEFAIHDTKKVKESKITKEKKEDKQLTWEDMDA